MPLAKCVRCDKLFDRVKIPVCKACVPDEEQDREKVRDALSEHGALNADELCEHTGVDRACVERMLDEGVIADQQRIGEFKCGHCGRPAISAAKRICQACLAKMNRTIQDVKEEVSKSAEVEPRTSTQPTARETLLRKRGY